MIAALPDPAAALLRCHGPNPQAPPKSSNKMHNVSLRCFTILSVTLSLGLASCEKQPTTVPTDGDAPVSADPDADGDDGDAKSDATAPETKEGGW